MSPPYPIPMVAPRQKGQGTCPRSHSEQKWDPSLYVFPIPLVRLSWAINVPISSAENLLCIGH